MGDAAARKRLTRSDHGTGCKHLTLIESLSRSPSGLATAQRELALLFPAGTSTSTRCVQRSPAGSGSENVPEPLQHRLAERRRRTLILRARLASSMEATESAGTGDARIGASEAEPGVEPAAARVRIEVAGGIVVGADLLVRRRAVALERRVLHVDRRLEQAVGRLGAAARDAQRRHHLRALRRAPAARRAVGRAVVALLAALDDAVAAALEPAGRRAAVAGVWLPSSHCSPTSSVPLPQTAVFGLQMSVTWF